MHSSSNSSSKQTPSLGAIQADLALILQAKTLMAGNPAVAAFFPEMLKVLLQIWENTPATATEEREAIYNHVKALRKFENFLQTKASEEKHVRAQLEALINKEKKE